MYFVLAPRIGFLPQAQTDPVQGPWVSLFSLICRLLSLIPFLESDPYVPSDVSSRVNSLRELALVVLGPSARMVSSGGITTLASERLEEVTSLVSSIRTMLREVHASGHNVRT